MIFSKVTGAQAIGFDVVSRLRDDAVLQYLYKGEQKGGRGRPKELDGVVDIMALREDVFETETVDVENETVILHSAIVKSLKHKIKVVVAELKCGGKTIRKILFSTNTTLKASGIFLIYHSRFQIEFLYRDAQNRTQVLRTGSPLMPTGFLLATTHLLRLSMWPERLAMRYSRRQGADFPSRPSRRFSIMHRSINILENLLRVRI